MRLGIPRLVIVAALGLAACSSVAPPSEGDMFIASNEAKLVTVVNMDHMSGCSVPEGTTAVVIRTTQFQQSNTTSDGRVLWGMPTDLSQVVLDAPTSPGCSTTGMYNFIKGQPLQTGWKKDIKPGTPEWIKALTQACHAVAERGMLAGREFKDRCRSLPGMTK